MTFEIPQACQGNGNKWAKILKNVKIHCMFMLSPMGHVMSKYMRLLMKMAIDGPNIDKGKLALVNFDLLRDVQILLGLATVLPLLQ
jgi:hypothetical protein